MEDQHVPMPPRLLAVALGDEPADIAFRNARLFNPFTCEWMETGFAVSEGYIAGLGDYVGRETHDLKEQRVVPGLIDAHVHIESSLLTPAEYARVVSAHGTTTVVADPHEIANVCGTAGLDYMLAEREGLPVDIFYMLPSCVPSIPDDPGGAVLTANDLAAYRGRSGILGLAEMMNVPGLLQGDPEVWEKLGLCQLIDGHAPLVSGRPLNACAAAGVQSDHESTSLAEAKEKLALGWYIFLREGSTERNLAALAPLATPCRASRMSFATDDRHADRLWKEGHIDDCIRAGISAGLEPELAIRMATLSPAERFRLYDRGALAPGRLADFCLLSEDGSFSVSRTFKRGFPADTYPARASACLRVPIAASVPDVSSLAIRGSGAARVIGLVPGQILTSALEYRVDGQQLPDLDRDILKAVVCSRYEPLPPAVGLVHGFGLRDGAIATSVSHDAHNIVAVGAADSAIRDAIAAVVKTGGGMAVADRDGTGTLPLECAGLMSALPAGEVSAMLDSLNGRAARLGSIGDPFMYLSFLALPVIPCLRLTARGLYDVDAPGRVDLFTP